VRESPEIPQNLQLCAEPRVLLFFIAIVERFFYAINSLCDIIFYFHAVERKNWRIYFCCDSLTEGLVRRSSPAREKFIFCFFRGAREIKVIFP